MMNIEAPLTRADLVSVQRSTATLTPGARASSECGTLVALCAEVADAMALLAPLGADSKDVDRCATQ